MKKILVMPDGNWLSHVSRPLEIAKVLRDMGHEIVFACSGYYSKLPAEEGFKVIPVKTLDPDHVLNCSRSGRVNWYDYKLVKEGVEADLEIFDLVTPDLVLADFRLSLSTSCELSKIPLAVILNAAWTNYYTVRVNAPEHLKITRILGKKITTFLSPVVKSAIVKTDAAPFRKFRGEKGLKEHENIWDVWRGDLNLMVDIPEYGPTKNLPPDFHYIGPIFWEPGLEVPDWFDKLDPGKPVVYFTMGSTGYPRFFQQAVEIFANSEYQCVMTTAGMVKLTSVPRNFFVTDYAPGSKIMEKSSAVVCHGGNGTIYQAMSKGVPVIGIPTMHDQEFNLDRVVDMGMGIHLSELKFKPSHLSSAVREIIFNKRYKENADRYKKILDGYNGPRKGAELIDNYINK